MGTEPSLDDLLEEGRWLNGCLDDLSAEEAGGLNEFDEDPDHSLGEDVSRGGSAPGPAVTGKRKRATAEGGAPAGYWKQRRPLLQTRITGRLQEVKGKFGWIWPDKPINHPDAGMHEGKIYLSHKDVEAEIPGVGTHVSFVLYADGSGLGAMNCRPMDDGAGEQREPVLEWIVPEEQEPQGPAPAKAGPERPAASSCSGAGTGRVVSPSLSPGHQARAGQEGPAWRPDGLGRRPEGTAWRSEGQDKHGWRNERNDGQPRRAEASTWSGSKKTSETKGMRARVSDVPVAGLVTSWKGSYGWIEPLELVKHPLFNGKIFLHINDVASGEAPEIGAQVAFLVYSDPDGLGAEHCTPLRAGAMPAPTAASAAFAQSAAAFGVPRPAAAPAAAAASPGMPLQGRPASVPQTVPAPQPPSPQQPTPSPSEPVGPAPSEPIVAPTTDPDVARRLAAWMENLGG
mmetsp:Transcript_28381/g.90323  ORF Transcript_28381/g.90323 Transcript_28381/m.90323 type:complete len:456 (-) Transcript_28381:370-1737(-)